MPVVIKNCGLKTPDAVDTALSSGATFIGCVLYPPSPRHIDAMQASQLTNNMPENVQSVAVMVNPSNEQLQHLLSLWKPNIIQLHGTETVERIQEVRSLTQLPTIKAIGIATAEDVQTASRYIDVADYLLLDTKHQNHGGTGLSFDWSLLDAFSSSIPWFLSGGLTVDNVTQAIAQTNAPAVDVSSGIESVRGVKDLKKMKLFNETVRQIHD